MPDVMCPTCGWSGSRDELLNDFEEDVDGDLVGDHINACPSCYGETFDIDQLNVEDLNDSYGS